MAQVSVRHFNLLPKISTETDCAIRLPQYVIYETKWKPAEPTYLQSCTLLLPRTFRPCFSSAPTSLYVTPQAQWRGHKTNESLAKQCYFFTTFLSKVVIPLCVEAITIILVPIKSVVPGFLPHCAIIMRCFKQLVLSYIRTRLPTTVDPLQLTHCLKHSINYATLYLTHLDKVRFICRIYITVQYLFFCISQIVMTLVSEHRVSHNMASLEQKGIKNLASNQHPNHWATTTKGGRNKIHISEYIYLAQCSTQSHKADNWLATTGDCNSQTRL